MRKWYIYVSVFLIITAYFIGSSHPLKYLQFEYDQTPVNRIEVIKVLVSIISAFLTFSAVTVALFKEKILALFNKPKLNIEMPSDKPNREIIADKIQIEKDDIIEATKHISRLIIKNKGNTVATDVGISLEKLEYRELNANNISLPYEPSGEPLQWNNNQDKVNIMPKGEKLINIVEIFAPKLTSTPDGKSEVEQDAELIIGNFRDCDKLTKAGVWTATFVLHAQNHKHITFIVTIEWQGKWKGRLVDFEEGYSYKLTETK
tara:strand:+ start:10617 stop:11399 length:783 start_codon:yes stop_codon:yes gene_type:complete